MDRAKEIEKEKERLFKIFKNMEPDVLQLVSGLLEETACLKAVLSEMQEIIKECGLVKISPQDNSRQKSLPIANEYRRTINVYAFNIKILRSILGKGSGDEEDEFALWVKEMRAKKPLI